MVMTTATQFHIVRNAVYFGGRFAILLEVAVRFDFDEQCIMAAGADLG